MIVVGVTGWRHHPDRSFVWGKLDMLAHRHDGQLQLRMGDADGVDAFAKQWCERNYIHGDVYRADRFPSGALKPGAGPARNLRLLTQERHVKWASGEVWYMSRRVDLLVGFPEPHVFPKIPGSGSWNCIAQAFTLGIEILIPPNIKIGE